MASKMKQGVVRSAVVAGIAGGAMLVSVVAGGAASSRPMGSSYNDCNPVITPGLVKAGCVVITNPSTSSSTTSVTVTTTAPDGTVPEVTTTTGETTTTMMGETTTTKPAVKGQTGAAKPATQVRGQANFTG